MMKINMQETGVPSLRDVEAALTLWLIGVNDDAPEVFFNASALAQEVFDFIDAKNKMGAFTGTAALAICFASILKKFLDDEDSQPAEEAARPTN